MREVYVWLGSQIGQPVNEPPMAAVQLILPPDQQLATVQDKARDVVRDGLANLGQLAEGLIDGTVRIY